MTKCNFLVDFQCLLFAVLLTFVEMSNKDIREPCVLLKELQQIQTAAQSTAILLLYSAAVTVNEDCARVRA